jgi:membrane protease YdiL (CAAX protease family)
MLRWGAMAYAVLAAAVSAGSLWWRGELPLRWDAPWLPLAPWLSHAYSALLGAAFAILMVFLSRVSVHHFRWGRRLHRELRPVATQLGTADIWMLAALSALGEELLFRGVLQPAIGLFGQAVLFGLLHQLPGPSRWIWVTWAACVGLLFGLLFQLTGSLWGPILGHALINGLNLNFLKHHNPDPRRDNIGGLLDRQT